MSELITIVTPLHAGLKAEGRTTLDVLVQVQGPSTPAGVKIDRPPLNLALVLDRSGSMGGRPLEEAKRAAECIVGKLTPLDRLALVAYDGRAKVLVSGRQVTDPAVFGTALRGIQSGGQTNMHGGWLAGLREILPGIAPGMLSRILLLSDGQANEGITDPGAQAQAASDAAGKGVGTSTYGLGTGFNEALMVDLAHHGQGRCYYGESAEDLLDPFLEEFAFLAARCASDVQVALQTIPGLVVTQATNHLPTGLGAWRLPELAWSSEVWILLKVDVDAATLPKGPEGSTVLFLNTSWKDRTGEEYSLPYQPMVLPLLSAEAFDALPEHPLVRNRLRELEVGKYEEQAYRAAVLGDRAGVRAALDALKALGKDDAWTLDRAMELEALAREADDSKLAKELYCGCSSSFGSHTRSVHEGTAEEKVEGYLRRKKRQGKGDGSPDL